MMRAEYFINLPFLDLRCELASALCLRLNKSVNGRHCSPSLSLIELHVV